MTSGHIPSPAQGQPRVASGARELPTPRRRDGLLVFSIALGLRLLVVGLSATRFGPTADGAFYHVIAGRIARGLGYTWLWPDGAVTYAAHYPVGYPAVLGAVYAVFGEHPWLGMVLNAGCGAVAAWLSWSLAAMMAGRRVALGVGLLVALHPALVAYTPALMTEGLTGMLLTASVWAVCKARCGERHAGWLVLVALLLAGSAMVRPQGLALVPFFAWYATDPRAATRFRVWRAASVLLLVGCLVLPWAWRNAVRLGHWGLSFNGGWNLLIGTDAQAGGTFAPLQVPAQCSEVFGEADKDVCFREAAWRAIRANVGGWLSLVPKKLAMTFDYCGAAGWYLHEANGAAFTARMKVGLGVAETVYVRGVLAAALVGAARLPGVRPWLRRGAALISLMAIVSPYGWVAVTGLIVVLALLGRGLAKWPVVWLTWLVLVSTWVTHAVFFGAGRYSLVLFALMTVLAATLWPKPAGLCGGRS